MRAEKCGANAAIGWQTFRLVATGVVLCIVSGCGGAEDAPASDPATQRVDNAAARTMADSPSRPADAAANAVAADDSAPTDAIPPAAATELSSDTPSVVSDTEPETAAASASASGGTTKLDELELPDDLDFSRAASLAELRRERDATVWREESLAQEYERALVRLWDKLIAAARDEQGDLFAVFAQQPLNSITVAAPAESRDLRWGARVAELNQSPQTLSAAEWALLMARFKADGYRIVQTEWHHAKFDPPTTEPARSVVAMAIYGEHAARDQRFVISGELQIVWQNDRDAEQIPLPDHIDASRLQLTTREGRVAFREWLTIDHAQPGDRKGVQPVLVQDLNDDGLSEIALGGSNEIMWNRGNGKFETSTLCDHPDPGFEVGLFADVTGDATLDYLRPGTAGDLLLYVGDASGRFTTPPLGRAQGGGPLRQPQVIAAGDVDRDGDLDLWIGQYKISYQSGQMPSPYYDANDGFPAYLLLNDGKGRFSPSTEESGLGEKQYRRSYGGSFVDLDGDGDLDLVVVSDFAGVDVYYNDGQGYFTDVTQQVLDERHLFGMAVTFSDYNVDGRLDFFATGMASTTARRLEYLKLGRTDRADVHMMRARMGYGNRMYLAGDSGFAQPEFKDQIARTGWTWGATSFDFDCDRYPDIFIANGHSSGQSTKDHCSHFWCHDIYDGQSEPNREVSEVFNSVLQGYFNRSESWDGYQKNALLVNLSGTQFVNLGFLMGVGHEFDGRAAISDDLDGDGRVDLIVVEDQWKEGQRLHVYRNELETGHHWIGVRLVDVPGRDSPLGSTVILTETSGVHRVACVTAGDSIHAQHATTVHFGLANQTAVQAIEIRYPSGRTQRLEAPPIDRYHRVAVD